MVAEPTSIVYKITLSPEEGETFNRKLPSESSIEMFGTAIAEGECNMDICIYKDEVIINVELYFRDNMSYADIKAEMKRIISEIETFLNEPE